MSKRWYILSILAVMVIVAVIACDDYTPTADQAQKNQQETILKEATAQTGMPAIKNFRERKILKDILELRDQTGLATTTYLYNEMQGKLVKLCDSVGYAIPYSTQYTSPERPARSGEVAYAGNITLPQADPNALFSPQSSEGTWVLCKNPNGGDVKTVYVEPRILVSPFPLTQ